MTAENGTAMLAECKEAVYYSESSHLLSSFYSSENRRQISMSNTPNNIKYGDMQPTWGVVLRSLVQWQSFNVKAKSTTADLHRSARTLKLLEFINIDHLTTG